MSKLCLGTYLNDCPVTLEFYWYGDEPDWDSMDVIALLPGICAPEAKHYVKINSLLSDAQWDKLESEIYLNEDNLKRQLREME